ncbi:hypothetical protein BP00DRAFT_487393 [Aspergillus indologenus CBS 114.80]|uniref:Uncharacterized protein n=1 Tax=Aspergillus indologenus CBS 114.80 TaxID=1450541 RepID=A0A2V5I0W0_9EURO|nr:hypothetical protein BP00DRAFT_487393 [Aspergillus indologenus CBS 114.80]
MKRSRSCSPIFLSSKRTSTAACLTTDALNEHDQNTRPVSPFALLNMALEQRISGLSDTPRLPPSSTRSSQRSRSSSPSKPSDAQYRRGPLRRANICVDEEIPMDIRRYTDSRVFHIPDKDHDLHKVSERLWGKSKELVRKPSGEAEWTEALYTAIDELRPRGLKLARNRDWREDLNPPVHNPRPPIPRKRHQSHPILPGNPTPEDTRYPAPHSVHAAEAAIPVFKLQDPRPAICVGLSDENLARALEPTMGRAVARSFLFDLQDTASLISDPHITPVGLRFPFLIVEAKAGATGGNLYQAQNHAAVGGSTALQIFSNLSGLQDARGLDDEGPGNREDSTAGSARGADTDLHLAFSVTTEGPIHELWLHFQRSREEDFCMVCLGTWRTTLKDGSLDFLRHLSAVLRWGNGECKDNIVSVLQGLYASSIQSNHP